jgi:XTP/dITP diphosphohydrolase
MLQRSWLSKLACYNQRVRVLLATTNQGKLIELTRIMRDLGIDLVGLSDSASTEEIETGSSFSENALLKARHFYKLSGKPTVADDSGLEVEALGGAPGIHSARYAGSDASDGDRVAKLLVELKRVPEARKTARFVCAAAFVWEEGERVFLGETTGTILDAPRGHNGFGYDPVFFYEPLLKTFAELTPTEKADVSHRGRAFRKLAAWLRESGVLDTRRSGDKIMPTADKTCASQTEG